MHPKLRAATNERLAVSDKKEEELVNQDNLANSHSIWSNSGCNGLGLAHNLTHGFVVVAVGNEQLDVLCVLVEFEQRVPNFLQCSQDSVHTSVV